MRISSRLLGDLLGQVLAPLRGQLRERDADDIAVRGGVEAQVGTGDGVDNLLGHRLVPRRYRQKPGFRRGDAGNLLDGDLVAVILDGDAVENGGVGAAGADERVLTLERLDALHHVLVGIFDELGDVFSRHNHSSRLRHLRAEGTNDFGTSVPKEF